MFCGKLSITTFSLSLLEQEVKTNNIIIINCIFFFLMRPNGSGKCGILKPILCPPDRMLFSCNIFIYNQSARICYSRCVCPAWASGIEDTKLFQRVTCPNEFVQAGSPLCAGVTPRSTSKSQAGLPRGMQ